MGSCTTSPVKSADARLADLRVKLNDLKNQLKECQELPDPMQFEDELLTQANGLLGRLNKDLARTREETVGYGYDTTDFETLSYQVQGFKADVEAILRQSSMRQGLTLRLGKLAPKDGLTWFHGTRMGFAVDILDVGYFNAEATGGSGKKFGRGTYFTQVFETAKSYGEGDCVFGINVAGLNILTAREASLGLEVLTGASWGQARSEIREAGNPCAALTGSARADGYDAVEFIESVEGHILVVLINIKVDRTNVVYRKD